jgi:hypothetical protein
MCVCVRARVLCMATLADYARRGAKAPNINGCRIVLQR